MLDVVQPSLPRKLTPPPPRIIAPPKPAPKKPTKVFKGPSVYYCPHCSRVIGKFPIKFCPYCATTFPQPKKFTFDAPIDISDIKTIYDPNKPKTYRSPSGRLMMKKEEVEGAIEEAISQLVEEAELLPVQARKAATFQRWLEEINIPYTRSIKKEEWLLGTIYKIEYVIEGLKHYSGATTVFFTLRTPKQEAYVSGTHGRTSENMLVFHRGKRLKSDLRTAFLYAQFSREMHGHTVEPPL